MNDKPYSDKEMPNASWELLMLTHLSIVPQIILIQEP